MLAQELRDLPGLVCRKIVGGNMDRLALRLMSSQVAQEGHELCRGVSWRRFAQHLTRLGIESGVQRQSAMAKVLKSMPLDSSRRQRQHRIKAIERLDSSLLVYTEHRRMRRRVQIQPNDVGRLGFKLRIIGGHVALHSMRLQPMLSPYPSDRHVMCAQFLG